MIAAPHNKSLFTVVCSVRIPSGTDGWMEYVPISEKRNVTVAAPQRLNEGKTTLLPELM